MSTDLNTGVSLSHEDMSGLSLRRMELLDDQLEDQVDLSAPALDIERMVNELVTLHEELQGAKRRKDWDHFTDVQARFSRLATGNPAYGKFKDLLTGKDTFRAFVTGMPEDKAEGMEYIPTHEALFLGHKDEQAMFNAPESEATAWPFFRPTEYFNRTRTAKALYFETLATHKELKEELRDLYIKKGKAIAWMKASKDEAQLAERKAAIKARYLELGLRRIEVVRDEIEDSKVYIEDCRKAAGLPTPREYFARKNVLRKMIGRVLPLSSR